MIILELPEALTEEIRINDKVYKLDITNFDLLRKIKKIFEQSTINTNLSDEELFGILEECQKAFMLAFNQRIDFSDNLYKNVFISRACLKQIYEIILKLQNDYLNLNYPIINDNELNKYLEMTQNLAKATELLNHEPKTSKIEEPNI